MHLNNKTFRILLDTEYKKELPKVFCKFLYNFLKFFKVLKNKVFFPFLFETLVFFFLNFQIPSFFMFVFPFVVNFQVFWRGIILEQNFIL